MTQLTLLCSGRRRLTVALLLLLLLSRWLLLLLLAWVLRPALSPVLRRRVNSADIGRTGAVTAVYDLNITHHRNDGV